MTGTHEWPGRQHLINRLGPSRRHSWVFHEFAPKPDLFDPRGRPSPPAEPAS